MTTFLGFLQYKLHLVIRYKHERYEEIKCELYVTHIQVLWLRTGVQKNAICQHNITPEEIRLNQIWNFVTVKGDIESLWSNGN